MDITKFDKNFEVSENVKREGLTFYNAEGEDFVIEGVFKEGEKFVRMPSSVARTVNDGVYSLNNCTAGGRVRFRCDSPYIAIYVKLNSFMKMRHFPLTGSTGCDIFERVGETEMYRGTYMPSFEVTDSYSGVVELGERKMRELNINLPTYAGVCELFIGVDKDTKFEKARKHKYEKPVVFYGSSITQGGCCGRPGNTYQAMLSNMLDFRYINLGFSGSARAEDTVVDYIKNLDMSVFVMDYDHNAPSIEHLEKTHEKMFLSIREKNPDLPIIFLPRPKFRLNEEEKKRAEIINKTYCNAIARGDGNVYHLANRDIMPEQYADCALVDNTHPTDIGFFAMAHGIYPVLKEILEGKEAK